MPPSPREVSPSQGNTLAQKVPEGWHMVSETARLVGRSADTIKTWHTNNTYEPSGWMQVGQLRIWLWSDADIEVMRGITKVLKPGPKPQEEE